MTTDTYFANGNEVQLFEQAFRQRHPGDAHRPDRVRQDTTSSSTWACCCRRPVVTISCHDDLTSSDLVGRFMVTGGDVVWTDGPLTRAVKAGAICYLDEVVEARHDSLAILHSLTDHRRALYLDRAGEVVEGAGDVHAGVLVQPGLPQLTQGAQTVVPPAVRHAADELPAARPRGRGDRRRSRHRADDRDSGSCSAPSRSAPPTRPSTSSRRPPGCLVTAAQLIAAGATELEAAEACILAPLSTDGAITDGLREVAAASLAPADASNSRLERSNRHGPEGAEAQEGAHRLPDRHLRLPAGDVRHPAVHVLRPRLVGSVNSVDAAQPRRCSVSLEDHHDESRLAQRRADKWMIVGAALMGMWAPGLIGFPIFMRGVWLQRQALRAGLSVRPMIVTLIGYLVLIDGMLNSLGWALDLVANHTLINRVLMVGWGNMFDAGYFWHYNELWVGGAAGPGEKAYVAGLILTVFSMRVAAAIGFLQMKRWGHQWMVVTCWMGVVIWSAYVFNMTMYADVRYAGVVFPVVGWWLYDIFYITPFLAIPYLHTVNREIFSD